MAAAKRRERRQLAIDVVSLFGTRRFECEVYLRTGSINEWRNDFDLPTTPEFRDASRSIRDAKKAGENWDIVAWVKSQEAKKKEGGDNGKPT